MADTTGKLARESVLFESKRDAWIDEGRSGKYVVIQGEQILGFFESSKAAFAAGVERYSPGEFFMSVILPRNATDLTFFGRVV